MYLFEKLNGKFNYFECVWFFSRTNFHQPLFFIVYFRYKNGQEINPSPRMITKQITSKIFELIVPEVSLDDTATYKVIQSEQF